MPPQPTQQIPIMQRVGGRGGGGGGGVSLAQVAISEFIRDQGVAQKKMMDNFGRLQEAQAMEASQNAARMTQAMNRVVAREDERRAREESRRERMGDREYQERYQEWTLRLREQAEKDLLATQTRVNAQKAAAMDFIRRMGEEQREFGDEIQAWSDLLHDPLTIDAVSRLPGGTERWEKMLRLTKLARLQHEQKLHSDYTGQVARAFTEIHEKILAGEPHVDLTKLYEVDPRELMSLGDADEWTNEELEELWFTGGYVPGGLYGRDPEDPAVRKYRNFNPLDFHSVMWALEDQQALALMTQRRLRDDYKIARLKWVRDVTEAGDKIQEAATQHSRMLETSAVQGAYYGVGRVVEDLASGKLTPATLPSSLVLKSGEFAGQDPGEALVTKILESMFVEIAGPGSDAFLPDLDALLRGEGDKGVLDTPAELWKGHIFRNILNHVIDQAVPVGAVPKGGDPIAVALTKAIAEMPNTPQKSGLIRSLMATPGEVPQVPKTGWTGKISAAGELQLQKGVERALSRVKQRAQRALYVVEAQPVMVGYHTERGSIARYREALVGSIVPAETLGKMDEKALAIARKRAERLATPAERQAALTEVEGEVPVDEGFDLEKMTTEWALELTPLESLVDLLSQHTSRPELTAAIFSGSYEVGPPEMPEGGMTTPELRALLQSRIERNKQTRERIRAEMKRRREEYERKSQGAAQRPEQQVSVGGSLLTLDQPGYVP